MITIKIPNEDIFQRMLQWRDSNKDSVRDIQSNGIESGIIEFNNYYRQHFEVIGDLIFMEILGQDMKVQFIYNPKTWKLLWKEVSMPEDFIYSPHDAIQDMLTTYATSMALIKERHGIIKSSNGDYAITM